MSLTFDTTPIASVGDMDVARLAAAGQVSLAPDLRAAFRADDTATGQLNRLFTEGAMCVTTGQQPGLLTGPLYTLYKALSAVVLAALMEQQLGRPVVPVFWVAGDDHDFVEASHTHVLTLGNEVTALRLPERAPDAPLTPMYKERLGDTIASVIETVTAQTPDTEFRPQVLAWLARHYRPEADLASAFGGALAELMGRFGLVVFDPTHPAAKAAMRPWLVRALRNAPAIDRGLGAHANQLRSADRPVPVHVGDRATTVMLECRLGRDRLVVEDGGFRTRRAGERYDLIELERLAEADPGRFSPNVLLRPVVEAAILPTLAYIGGPGELAYLPQCAPVYKALGIVPQAHVPRWSARFVETKIRKVLDAYAIAIDDLHLPEGQLERRLVSEEMPADAVRSLATLRETMDEEFARLRTAAASLDPTLAKPVDTARYQAAKGVDAVEKRLVGHLKQRNTLLASKIAKARANLFPLGKPQERVLNGVPYLIRYGDTFLDTARSAALDWYGALEPLYVNP